MKPTNVASLKKYLTPGMVLTVTFVPTGKREGRSVAENRPANLILFKPDGVIKSWLQWPKASETTFDEAGFNVFERTNWDPHTRRELEGGKTRLEHVLRYEYVD